MKVSKRTIAIGVACAALGSLGGGYAIAGTGSDSGTKASSAERSDEEHGDKGERHQELTGSALSKASDAALEKVGEGRVTETEKGDGGEAAYEVEVTKSDGSQVDVELDAAFAVTAVKADDPEGTDSQDEGDDEGNDEGDGDEEGSGQELTGSDLTKASKAALDKVGEGKVTKTEQGDDGEAAFEVEVTKDDGSQVDVELDASFAVTAAKADTPEAGDHAD